VTRIVWHGHSCFEIVSDNNIHVAIDPHDGYSIGLPPPRIKADLVLVTHDHYDHNAVEGIVDSHTKVRCCLEGEEEIMGVKVRGVKLPHDKFGGKRRGWIHAYHLEIDGFRMLHLGDIGIIPSRKILGEPHVLFIPVGGTYTISADEAWSIVESLKPPITIPMHYWVPGMMMPLDPIDEFLKFVKKIRIIRMDTGSIDVRETLMPEEPRIIVLKHPSIQR